MNIKKKFLRAVDNLRIVWLNLKIIYYVLQILLINIVGGIISFVAPPVLSILGFPVFYHSIVNIGAISGCFITLFYIVFIGLGSMKFLANWYDNITNSPFWQILNAILKYIEEKETMCSDKIDELIAKHENDVENQRDLSNPNTKWKLSEKVTAKNNIEIFDRLKNDEFLSYESSFCIKWNTFGNQDSWYRNINVDDYRLTKIYNAYKMVRKEYNYNKRAYIAGKIYINGQLFFSPQNPYTDGKVHTQYDFVCHDLRQEIFSSPNYALEEMRANVTGGLYEIATVLQLLSCKDFDEYVYYNWHFPLSSDNIYGQMLLPFVENLMFWMYIDQCMTVNFVDIHALDIEERFTLMINQLHKMHLLHSNSNYITFKNCNDFNFMYKEMLVQDYGKSLVELVEKVSKIEEKIKDFPMATNVPTELKENLTCSPEWFKWYASFRKRQHIGEKDFEFVNECFNKHLHLDNYYEAFLIENTATHKKQVWVTAPSTLFVIDSNENNFILYDEDYYTVTTFTGNHKLRYLDTIQSQNDFKLLTYRYDFEHNFFSDKELQAFHCFNPKYVRCYKNTDNIHYLYDKNTVVLYTYKFIPGNATFTVDEYIEECRKKARRAIESWAKTTNGTMEYLEIFR